MGLQEELKKEFTVLDRELNDQFENLNQTDITLVELLTKFAKSPDETQKEMIARLNCSHEIIQKLLGKASEPALIAEYNSLSSFINARRTQQSTVNAFLVTGASFALTFAVGTMSSPGIRGLVSLIAVLLVSVAWINWRGLRVVDSETYERIHKIESELNVRGHKMIIGIIRAKTFRKRFFYMARDVVWDLFYMTILVGSLLTAAHLFWPWVPCRLPLLPTLC